MDAALISLQHDSALISEWHPKHSVFSTAYAMLLLKNKKIINPVHAIALRIFQQLSCYRLIKGYLIFQQLFCPEFFIAADPLYKMYLNILSVK